MSKRAEDVELTRLRITEAAVALHTSIGPAHTTISGLAERAGVTRVTVYRHFPDEESLFKSCQAHWMAAHLPPNPALWAEVEDVVQRVTRAVGETYGWYKANNDDLYPIMRDRAVMPESVRRIVHDADLHRVSCLIVRQKISRSRVKNVRSIVGHSLDYWTWRSLVVIHGLPQAKAIDFSVASVLDVLS